MDGKDYEFLKNEIVKIDTAFIEELKNRAKNRESGKYRYCLHESEESNLQEMVFVIAKGQYNPPDKHHFAETKIILDGEAWILLFEDNGDVKDTFRASAKDMRFCRVEKGIYHAIEPITDQVVIYEVREGKHTSKSNVYPEWAPRFNVTEEHIETYKKIIEKATNNR